MRFDFHIPALRRAPAVSPVRLVSGLAVAGLVLLLACSSENQKRTGRPPAPVVAGNAVRKDMPVLIDAIGTVEAYNTVSIKARIGGELTRVGFTEGQDVRQGDLLFTIDPRPYQAALQAALADSARDAAQAASAEADARRYAELIQKDYVTQQQYDQVTANAQAAEASLQAGIASVENARLNLDYCFIHAPLSGRTGNLLVHRGNLIKADDTNPLVVINQTEPIYVSFSVPEKYLSEIRRYAAQDTLRVRASLPSDPQQHFGGKLTFIDNAVDAATGMIFLKATFPNKDRRLWPGQFVNVSMVLTMQEGVVVVPSGAVQTGQQGDYVFRIQPDLTVQIQPVTVGTNMNGETIIEKGLAAGDRVVTDGQLRLAPGAKVEIKPGLDHGETVSQ